MTDDNDQPDAGNLICTSESADVPPWGMYLAGLAVTPFGLIMLVTSVPLLLGNRPGDFTGGAAGAVLGLILTAAGAGAFISARNHRPLRFCFHEHGVLTGRAPELAYIPYESLDDIFIEIQEPSTATGAFNIARGALSLLVGNGAGAGWALRKLKTQACIHYRTTSDQKYTIISCPHKEAERLGWHLENRFDLQIIHRAKV